MSADLESAGLIGTRLMRMQPIYHQPSGIQQHRAHINCFVYYSNMVRKSERAKTIIFASRHHVDTRAHSHTFT